MVWGRHVVTTQNRRVSESKPGGNKASPTAIQLRRSGLVVQVVVYVSALPRSEGGKALRCGAAERWQLPLVTSHTPSTHRIFMAPQVLALNPKPSLNAQGCGLSQSIRPLVQHVATHRTRGLLRSGGALQEHVGTCTGWRTLKEHAVTCTTRGHLRNMQAPTEHVGT